MRWCAVYYPFGARAEVSCWGVYQTSYTRHANLKRAFLLPWAKKTRDGEGEGGHDWRAPVWVVWSIMSQVFFVVLGGAWHCTAVSLRAGVGARPGVPSKERKEQWEEGRWRRERQRQTAVWSLTKPPPTFFPHLLQTCSFLLFPLCGCCLWVLHAEWSVSESSGLK